MTAPIKYPNKHWIKRYLHYNPFTGQFIRIQRSSGGRYGLGVVKNLVNHNIKLHGICYSLNKLAWVYMNGSPPPSTIRHIDGDPNNYIFKNLKVSEAKINKGGIVTKYTEETIMLVAGLADLGTTIREASLSLDIPKGSVSTLARKNNIRFKGTVGRKRVDNPVRPYRPYQKQHYESLSANTIDESSLSLMKRKW